MTIETAYSQPHGKDINPYMNSEKPVKTNEDIINHWLLNGYEWYTANKNVPFKSLQTRGTKLYWRDILVAEHFERYTIIYENTRRSVHDIVVLLRSVMEAANWKPLEWEPRELDEVIMHTLTDKTPNLPTAPTEPTETAAKEIENLSATLDVIFGDS